MKSKPSMLPKVASLTLAPLAIGLTAQASTDYGPAIWRASCNANYYTTGYGHKFHVIHDMEGYYWNVISRDTSCGWTGSSEHYCINGKSDAASDSAPGEISQIVRDANYAWHALCWNQHSTGTEHEGFVSNPAWYTEAQYQASAGLTRNLAAKFGWPKDRNHIVGHNEKSSAAWVNYANANLGINATCNTHSDPGPYWDWSHYMALVNGGGSGGSPNPHINPCIGRNADGRQEIFAVGKDGQMYHMYQTSPNAGWTGWLSLQGGLAQNCVPAVGQNLDGRLELFAVAGGAVWHTYQNSVNSSGSWATWSSLGGSLNGLTTLAVGRNADGRLEVFGVGTGGDLQHMYQTAPNSGWTGWSSLGGSWSGTACIKTGMNLDGRMEIFMIGNTAQMYHNYQTAANGGWVGWSSFGGSFNQDSRFCVGRNSDGRLEVFAISTAGDLQHLYQTTPNGSWYGWPSLGGLWDQAAQPVCGLSADGKLEVFVIGTTGQFYQNYFNGSAWTGWGSLGGSFSQDIRPCIVTNQDGRLEIFTTAPTSDMVHAYQNTANSGSSWTAWPSLGGSWN